MTDRGVGPSTSRAASACTCRATPRRRSTRAGSRLVDDNFLLLFNAHHDDDSVHAAGTTARQRLASARRHRRRATASRPDGTYPAGTASIRLHGRSRWRCCSERRGRPMRRRHEMPFGAELRPTVASASGCGRPRAQRRVELRAATDRAARQPMRRVDGRLVRARPSPAPARAARYALRLDGGRSCPTPRRAATRTTCTRRARSSIRSPSTGTTATGAAGRGTRR